MFQTLKNKASINFAPEILVAQIHEEFNTASDKALAQARKILEKRDEGNVERLVKLRKLGFNNTEEVMKDDKSRQERKVANETMNTILYYASKYPQYKYIKEEDVNSVCKKYSLVFGRIWRYKGFVPLKNLKEIEAFSIEESDKKLIRYFFDRPENERGMMMFSSPFENKDIRPDTMHICAPRKEMKIGYYEEVDENGKIKHIPDPIILQPVEKGGYLIVTAWGKEASDPLIENDI